MTPIETERLVLRPFGREDAAFVLELLNDPGWRRHIGDRGVRSLEAARRYVEDVLVDHHERLGFGLLAMTRRIDGVPVGACGLLRREGLDDADLGFALLARFEGLGLAREAALAVLVHAGAELGLRRVVAITGFDNERAARLLEGLGMRREGSVELPRGEGPLRLYALDLDVESPRHGGPGPSPAP